MAKNLDIQAPVVDSYGNPVLNIEEDSSLSIDTSAVENYASPVLVVDDATADYVAYIEFGGSGDITNYYTKAEVDAIIARYATKEEVDSSYLKKSGGVISGDISIKRGIEVDLGDSTTPFNQVYASEFIEGSKSLSEKYASRESLASFATKAEASDFVNVGVKDSLQDAINSIPYRVGLQVVTFTNRSTLRRKTIAMWFNGLFDGAQLEVSINGKSSHIITVIGGDNDKMNGYIYDMLIQDEVISSCVYSHSFSSDYQTMIFTFNEREGDARVSWIGSIGASCEIKIPQQFQEMKNESYQLKYNTTEDSVFLNTENWEKDQDSDTWEVTN